MLWQQTQSDEEYEGLEVIYISAPANTYAVYLYDQKELKGRDRFWVCRVWMFRVETTITRIPAIRTKEKLERICTQLIPIFGDFLEGFEQTDLASYDIKFIGTKKECEDFITVECNE